MSTVLLHVTGPVKIDHLRAKIVDSFVFARFIITINNYLYYCNKIFITTGKFNGLSSAGYGNGILHVEWKILHSQNIIR